MYIGRRTKSGVIALGIYVISYFIFCVWETRRVFRYKKMKMRMTKRINVVIEERRVSNRRGSTEPVPFQSFSRYGYIFTGLDEYEGVTFDGRLLRVKTKYEKGEVVSLLINQYNQEEFWFEEADDPGKRVIAQWILWFLTVVVYLLFMVQMLRNWDRLRWF